MKYKTNLYRTFGQHVQVEADSPHEACRLIKEQNPNWHFDYIEELKEEGQCWEIVSGCESCNKSILEGDKYYHWNYEDTSVSTCEKCGGADDKHLTETA